MTLRRLPQKVYRQDGARRYVQSDRLYAEHGREQPPKWSVEAMDQAREQMEETLLARLLKIVDGDAMLQWLRACEFAASEKPDVRDLMRHVRWYSDMRASWRMKEVWRQTVPPLWTDHLAVAPGGETADLTIRLRDVSIHTAGRLVTLLQSVGITAYTTH